jgi:two-component system phosphate regulon sensor histidine kinase PhoR
MMSIRRWLGRLRQTRPGRGLTGWLAAGVCVSIALLTWSAWRAIAGWERSAAQLAERRASEVADLLLTALARDMRGVQTSVLTSPYWDSGTLDPPSDVTRLVATAFARYPYPESFFAWRGVAEADRVLWFTRAERRPAWMPGDGAASRFPVEIVHAPAQTAPLLDRIRHDAALGRRFSIVETTLGQARYQVVARLLYRDPYREHLDGAFGFVVNLEWVKQHYFPELTKQVARIGRSTGVEFTLALFDGQGTQVAGAAQDGAGGTTTRRSFPLMFFDPWIVALDPPKDLAREPWSVQVRMDRDPSLVAPLSGANRTLIIVAVAAATLAVGLVLTARAARASATLAELRSEFVATVTHELKTPIATIRAAGDTLVRGRVTGEEEAREYGHLVVQEAKRLTRLVNNLLAHARVTDVAERYAFEPLDLGAVVAGVRKEFQAQLAAGGFEVEIDIPADLPPVAGDHAALRLALENVVDNAIRYSGDHRWIRLAARRDGPCAQLDIVDRGIGIPADEIVQVTHRFYRGRAAPSGGSGLGLAIVRRIIEAHGGTLAIRSLVGAGTTVSLTLPLAEHGLLAEPIRLAGR